MPKINAVRRAKLKRVAARNLKHATPSLPKSVAAALSEGPAGSEAVATVIQELAVFRGPNAAYRQSNAYYYAALAKLYDIWLRISRWPITDRQELLVEFNRANEFEAGSGTRRGTTRGSDLHILLRFLIPHNGDTQAEQRLRSRDAAALRQAARLGWTPLDFATKAEGGHVGLDQLARDDIAARRLEKARGAKTDEDDPASTHAMAPEVPPQPPVERSYKWVTPNAFRRRMRAGHFEGREIFVRCQVEDDKIRLLDAYQPSGTKSPDGAWTDAMAYIEAREIFPKKRRAK